MKNDKRLFYRIDVMMPCSFRIVSHEALNTDVLPSLPNSKFIEEYFMKDLNELNDHISEVISQINVKSSLLASGLSALNSKLNFIMHTIDADQLTRAIPQRLVNLSGGGISFVVNEKVDTRNKMDLLLHPISSEHPILVRCDIINSTALSKDDDAYRVSLQFQHLTEDDRRKLVYFIHSQEIEKANEARKSTES